MFEIPGISRLLGTEKLFYIVNPEEVFQNPSLFILLITEKIRCSEENYLLYWDTYGILHIVEKALAAYDQDQRYVGFNNIELEICSLFLFGRNIFGNDFQNISFHMCAISEGVCAWTVDRVKYSEHMDRLEQIRSDIEMKLLLRGKALMEWLDNYQGKQFML